MVEAERAVELANAVLDRVNGDPDDDIATLARQFLRAREQIRDLAATVGRYKSQRMPSGLDMLMDEQPPANPDGSRTWFAVSNPKAVRNQPMAIFRLQTDARLIGGRMTLGEIEVTPVVIKLPDDVPQPDAPQPPITIVTNG